MSQTIELPPDRRLTKRTIEIGETHTYYTHFPTAPKEPVPGSLIVNEMAFLCNSMFGPGALWQATEQLKFWRPLKIGEWVKTTITLTHFDEEKLIARLLVILERRSNGKKVFTADYSIVLLR